MPLLSLPAELLTEIIHLAIQSPTPGPNSCIAPFCPGIEDPPLQPCTLPSATSLAHTCRLLRTHTLPPMYASLTVHPSHTRTLHTHLSSTPHIAHLIHTLTFFITSAPASQLLHGIIRRCPNLHDLHLDGSLGTGDFIGTLLIPARLHSLTLRTFEWLELWAYLSTAPASLHTLRLQDPVRPFELVPNSGAPVAVPRLPQVQEFICHTAGFDRRGARHAGGWLSYVVPNAKVLDIHVSDVTMGLLRGYVSVGLTELKVHFLKAQPGFCEAVAGMAGVLRRVVVHGGCVCEVLFGAGWCRVEVLEVVCRGGCRGVKGAAVRGALVRLVEGRPAARVSVVVGGRAEVEGGRELVRSGGGGAAVVAAVEEFVVLEEVWEDY